MDVNKVLTRINEDNLEELLPENGIPIVLACIRHDENLKEVLTTLAKVAHWFGNAVRSCYALEDMAPYFRAAARNTARQKNSGRPGKCCQNSR